MACCVFAAFLIAQCVATIRRWGMFWGIVAVPAGESADTLVSRLRSYLAIKWVRIAVVSVLVVEFLSFGGWVYLRHGEHIAEFTDIAWSRLHGQSVVYVDVCGKRGGPRTRLVFDSRSVDSR